MTRATMDPNSLFPQSIQSLAMHVVAAFRHADARLVTAESLTVGLIAASLADVPDVADVLEGGAVTYSVALKTALLGVDPATLARDGAVSESTAAQMARGALDRARRADVAVAVTGVAGPSPLEGKPPGTVFVAAAVRGRDAMEVRVRLHHFVGDGVAVRLATVEAALGAALEMVERVGR